MTSSNATANKSAKSAGFLRHLLFNRRFSGLLLVIAFIVGAAFAVPAFDYTDRYFSSEAFCSDTCHSMQGTVAKELRESDHYNTDSGVQATCRNCHIPEGLTAAMWTHVIGTKDLIAYVMGVRTVEDYEEIRAENAEAVRLRMVKNDSKNCRSCHNMAAIKPERTRGQKQHAEARKNGTTCIACHYNLVHKEVEPSEEFLKAIGE